MPELSLKRSFPQLAVTTLLFSLVTLVSSLFPLWGNLPINILIPLFVMLTSSMVFFEKLKISTLVLGKCLLILMAFSLIREKTFVLIIVVLMYINITEATLTDFKNKRYFNFISGLALLATTFILFNYRWEILLQSDGGFVHSGYYTTEYAPVVFWIAAYTIWNWNFVIGEFSSSIGKYHVAVLVTPLLLSLVLRNPGFWWIARSSSLTFSLLLQIRYKERIENDFYSESFSLFVEAVKTRHIQIILMAVNILLVVLSIPLFW